VFGVLGFGALLTASLFARLQAAVLPLALLGGATAVVLLVLQATAIGAFCTLCVVVDASAILIAGLALRLRRTPAAAVSDLHYGAWLVLGTLAATIPAGWQLLRPAPGDVPAAVRALYRSGKINVVEYADFECPFCRALHPRLKALLADYGERVHLIRLNLPLDRHPNARGAARAAICAAEQGKGEPMADALFASTDLSPAEIRRLAARIGVDQPRFDACVQNPETDRRIDREAEILRQHGLQGLPTVFIGDQVIVGLQPEEVFRDALERAATSSGRGGLPAPLYAGLAALALGLTVFLGRRSLRARP
jgi:protein-disulfide isomerase